MSLLLPRQVGAVRVRERLGEGGMAFVHRGEDPFRPDRALAVKLLRPEAVSDPEVVRRFLREGEVLKRLRHPHLVEVVDFGRAGSTPYLVMELLPGGSIKACLGEPPAAIVRRLLGPLAALQVAHEAGVVHRDLKPSNLLFAGDGRLKVTDFGVCLWEAGEEKTRLTRSRMVVGTVGYMAPEQHGDPRRVDARTDVYALGAILYEFSTGQAYAGVQLPPAAVRPGFPPGLAAILMAALAPDPSRRTPSMDAFREQLQGWLERAEAAGWGEEPLPGHHPGAAEQPTRTVAKGVLEEAHDPEVRLGPYLDALRAGGVGSRRAAAEGLRQEARPADEPWLLAALSAAPEGARFALAAALGDVGASASLDPLLALREDPYARGEACDAAARVALRTGRREDVLPRLREAGLGSPWRWPARGRLGDEAWVRSLEEAWGGLTAPLRIQALEAGRGLPEALRVRLRRFTAEDAARLGGRLREVWALLEEPLEG